MHSDGSMTGKTTVEVNEIRGECNRIYRLLTKRPRTTRALKYDMHMSEGVVTNRLRRLKDDGKVRRRRSEYDGRVWVWEVDD